MPKKKINSRAKGIRGELEACKLLEQYGFPAHRSQQYKGSHDSSDIEVPRFEQLHLFPEVKRVEQLRLGAWMKQCHQDLETHHFGKDDDSPDGLLQGCQDKPLIMHRRTKEPWMITMEATDFLDLINQLQEVHDFIVQSDRLNRIADSDQNDD